MPKEGYKQTEEHKEKMKLNNKGKKFSKITKQKMSLAHKGKKHSEQTKKKISQRVSNPSESTRKKISLKRIKRFGEKSPNWKGGICPINKRIRNSKEYRLWRTAVFERDNYMCIFCGQTESQLNVDHIKPFSLFPELRFAIDNGRTLCEYCHKKTNTYGNKIHGYANKPR